MSGKCHSLVQAVNEITPRQANCLLEGLGRGEVRIQAGMPVPGSPLSLLNHIASVISKERLHSPLQSQSSVLFLRAGRCRPGICFRLFSRLRFQNMLEFQTPELLRMPLQVEFFFVILKVIFLWTRERAHFCLLPLDFTHLMWQLGACVPCCISGSVSGLSWFRLLPVQPLGAVGTVHWAGSCCPGGALGWAPGVALSQSRCLCTFRERTSGGQCLLLSPSLSKEAKKKKKKD